PVSKCSAVVPTRTGTGATGLTFHNENKPRLNTATAAMVTAAVSQRREDMLLTGATTRGQRGRTGVSSSDRACARTLSREYSGSVRASRRSRAITDTRRNSSTWTGEAFSHAARAADSRASSSPSSLATSQAAACSAIVARTCSSLEIMDSTQPRHAALTVTQPLRHVLLGHLRGNPEVDRDLPVGQFVREAQDHSGTAFRTQLLQHDSEPRDPLPRIQFAVERGQRLELLLRRSLVDINAAGLPTLEHRMLLHEIVGDRVEVVDGIANRLLVADAQHPYVYLLCQVRCIGLAADSPPEERL